MVQWLRALVEDKNLAPSILISVGNPRWLTTLCNSCSWDPVPSSVLPRQCMHVCIHMLIHINTCKHKSLRNAEGPEVMLGRERLKALESLKQEDEFKASSAT